MGEWDCHMTQSRGRPSCAFCEHLWVSALSTGSSHFSDSRQIKCNAIQAAPLRLARARAQSAGLVLLCVTMPRCLGLWIHSSVSLPCVPSREKKHVYLGDKNSLNLTFHAQNLGEGGAYEAELRVTAPLEAEYSGLVRHPGVRRDSQVGCSGDPLQRGAKA